MTNHKFIIQFGFSGGILARVSGLTFSKGPVTQSSVLTATFERPERSPERSSTAQICRCVNALAIFVPSVGTLIIACPPHLPRPLCLLNASSLPPLCLPSAI